MLNSLVVALMLQTSQAKAPTIFDYIYCVTDASERLEPSGEPVADVVNAALFECRPLEGRAQPGSIIATLSQEQQESLQEQLRKTVGDGARKRLIGLRACRNTAGCNPASVPPAFDNLPPRRP